MDDVQIGSALRRLRIHAAKRQVDVARSAGVSQSLISAIECGRLDSVSLATIRRIFAVVGARFDGHVLWRGAALDHLIDERHARLVAASVTALSKWRWDVRVEVSYAVYGERGSIDLLGGRADRCAVVAQEVKTELVRLEEMIRKLDETERLVRRQLASERFGWTPEVVGRVLVMPDTDRARPQIHAHARVLGIALSSRGGDVRRWLQDPVGPMSGILFVADMSPEGPNATRVGVQRVRVGSGRIRRVRSVADAGSADVRDHPTDRASALGRERRTC